MPPDVAITILRISGILIFGLLLSVGARGLCRGLITWATKRNRGRPGDLSRITTLITVANHLVYFILWIAIGIILLDEFGVGIGPLLAGAGILGAAAGLGVQPILKDILSGATSILEDRIRVGEIAVINGKQGTVEEVGLRSVVLRDWDGTLHITAHSKIDSLSNLSRTWSASLLEVPVSVRENVDHVTILLQRIGDEMAREEKWASRRVKVKALGPTAISERFTTVQVRITTAPTRQWGAAREFHTRVLRAFKAQNIAHTTLGAEPMRTPVSGFFTLDPPATIPDTDDE